MSVSFVNRPSTFMSGWTCLKYGQGKSEATTLNANHDDSRIAVL